MIYHGQYGEGFFLVNYFENNPPKHKFLVDVGAGGIAHSNTIDLLQLGWSGILIEPFPIEKYFTPFKEMLDIAISDFCGRATAYVCDTAGWSSLLPPRDNIKHLFTQKDIEVSTLSKVLTSFNVPFDFDLLSVDAEGLDFKIISCLLEKSDYMPKIIVYEEGHTLHGNSELDNWTELFRNYDTIYKTQGNRIMQVK